VPGLIHDLLHARAVLLHRRHQRFPNNVGETRFHRCWFHAALSLWLRTLRACFRPEATGFGDADRRNMSSAEKQSEQRLEYDRAICAYVDASAVLTVHAVKGTKPTDEELRAERDARVALERARRAYLDWLARLR
jgi:hypothetical protein